MKPRTDWHVPMSRTARNTINPLDSIELNPHPDKQMIALSIGKLMQFGVVNIKS